MTSTRFFSYVLPLVAWAMPQVMAATPGEMEAAREVIQAWAGKETPPVEFRSVPDVDGCPAYTTEVKDGKLILSGSNGVALCKGFYDYVRSQGAGVYSWSGKRIELPALLKDSPLRKVVSPVPHHYYFNVVTYGYSLPYWDWKRWSEEIDWMALHGVDMPLALVAQEAISARVFKRLGLTDKEIAEYFVGPAHLPWMRMGNISGIDGPVPQHWHKDQVALQHKILKRMRSLGMTPVCPGFAGFVPPAIQRVEPSAQLVKTSWCGGAFHNWMITPDHPLFARIGSMFIEEWEKEFGKCSHYIIDSFNEMEVPFPPHGTPERYNLLADYGEKVYGSIKAASPDAVWVMQGWMFGYQRGIWDQKTLSALVSRVPDDKMLMLDLAVDYNKHFWHNGYNWDHHKGYYNKGWVYSVVPNMGGKCGLTGVLDFYANGHLAALKSPNRGRMLGIGMAPEGIENNEVIYELMTEAGWSSQEIDTTEWLRRYSASRYGKTVPGIDKYWELMRQSVYGSFTDHPRYCWQLAPGTRRGSIRANDQFYRGIEAFAACAPELKDSPLYEADLRELAAAYLGGKVELLIQASEQAMQDGDMDLSRELEKKVAKYMLAMDRLLEFHPTQNLGRWLSFARKKAADGSGKLQAYYERNARRIVTIWGPPVDDYSARIWGGLIRDYYLPRRQQYLQGRYSGKRVNVAAWERNWVEKRRGVSKCEPYPDAIAAACELIQEASRITPESLSAPDAVSIGSWSPEMVSTEWREVSWSVSPEEIKKAAGIRFRYTRGNNKLDIAWAKVEMDGAIVAEDVHNGSTGTTNTRNVYRFSVPADATGNNSCRIIARVRSDGQANSYGSVEIVPAKK